MWKLGTGATGDVMLAINTSVPKHSEDHKKRRVAIKIMKKNGDVGDLSRLDNEIKAMMMLKHENIVQLLEVFEDEKKVYFAMELCGGGTLADYTAVKVSRLYCNLNGNNGIIDL
jgi:serine/threonine protein kinase